MSENQPSDALIDIEVAYATPEKQRIAAMRVAVGCTAREAVLRSDMAAEFPEIDAENAPLGIFGNALGVRGLAAAEAYELKQGDRIEIYRPLIADPKEVRKARAAEAQARREKDEPE